MMVVDGVPLQPGEVVRWLSDALVAPAVNPAEASPAERLAPALAAAPDGVRKAALHALASALATTDDDRLRVHLMVALQGFDSAALRDVYVALLDPAPAPWLSHPDPELDGPPLAHAYFHLVTHSAGAREDHIAAGLRRLAETHGFMDRALPFFVAFHPGRHGFELLVDALDRGYRPTAQDAARFGGRFARDAKQHLQALGEALGGHAGPVRQAFFDAAEWRLDDVTRHRLRQALDV